MVWYRLFPDGPGLNFMAQPNGRYVARPATPDPNDRDPWVEIDLLGNVTGTFGCQRQLVPRFHDLILNADGSRWLLCDETRTMDLSALGGSTTARVMGTGVQRVSAAGALLFEWSPFDHFDIADVEPGLLAGPTVNWTHGNALDLDSDGNLVVSFRNLNEITKIDTRTGAVMWRMGGRRNQFSIQNTTDPSFMWQHGLRLSAPGELLLLDNLGESAGSRAERYAYDATLRTTRLIGSLSPGAPVFAQQGGTTQTLPNGHALVSFGTAGRVVEYDANDAIVWQIEGNAGYVFRAQRIRSLYRPGVEGPP